jgi:hypothetical protein
MLDWMQLAQISDVELARYDVAEVNLACAAGLTGSERINVEHCLRKLDHWAEWVSQYTDRMSHRFHNRPAAYGNSWAYFRTLAMITALQRDLGVRYNPAKIPAEVPLDTEDTFIHGVIQGNGGTCASLPVVYIAVGRRLGYPLKLVQAMVKQFGHLFARWEEPFERFNVEGTNQGLGCHPDEYYRTDIYQITPEQEQKGSLLRSLSPKQELAVFLMQAARWLDVGRRRLAVHAIGWACALHPENWIYQNTLKMRMNEWGKELEGLEPPGFPPMYYIWPQRRFPATLPGHVGGRAILRVSGHDVLRVETGS